MRERLSRVVFAERVARVGIESCEAQAADRRRRLRERLEVEHRDLPRVL